MPWRRNWQPTQVFLPGTRMDREAWWATVWRVAKSQQNLPTKQHQFLKKFYRCIFLNGYNVISLYIQRQGSVTKAMEPLGIYQLPKWTPNGISPG